MNRREQKKTQWNPHTTKVDRSPSPYDEKIRDASMELMKYR